MSMLMKYVAMVHEHCMQVLDLATTTAALSPRHFTLVARALQVCPPV